MASTDTRAGDLPGDRSRRGPDPRARGAANRGDRRRSPHRPPTGLTIVTGLEPTSRVLAAAMEEAVERFMREPPSTVEDRLESVLNIIPNDRELVRSWLTRGVIAHATEELPR